MSESTTGSAALPDSDAQDARTRVAERYRLLAEGDRQEAWITLRPEAEVAEELEAVLMRVGAGEQLPLAGLLFAVKNNIDVAGIDTTAACPAFAYAPDEDATTVARLRAAGAVVLGATNLDQFATGLVGSRSPYGAVRHAVHPELISGGSSSGSAVAVALGAADFALGTDTAGSGRVPAAFHGLYGVKPTKGWVPAGGVVPACRSQDVVTVMARDLDLAQRVTHVMVGVDPRDPLSRAAPARTSLPERTPLPQRTPFPEPTPLPEPVEGRVDDRSTQPPTPLPEPVEGRVDDRGTQPRPVIAVPQPGQLGELAPGWAEAFERTVERMRDAGAEIVEVDVAPLLEAAALLYGGAFVAERYAAVGEFVDAHPDEVDPTVGTIISAAKGVRAFELYRDLERLDGYRVISSSLFAGIDALLLPTTTRHPTLAAVAADPIGENSALGRFTNFANLLDLAALAFPAGEVQGLPFGAQLVGAAFTDSRLAAIAPLGVA